MIRVILDIPNPEYSEKYAGRRGIDSHQVSDESLGIALDPSRGDEVMVLGDGRIRIVQDAMVFTGFDHASITTVEPFE